MNMKVVMKSSQELEVKYVKVELPIRYGEEDIPKNFPLREEVPADKYGYDWWKGTIDINTGKILEWPLGESGEFYLKVVDEGSYYLLDENQKIVASIKQDYVPNQLLPPTDGYGDYVDFEIDVNGIITNWYKKPVVSDFFNG